MIVFLIFTLPTKLLYSTKAPAQESSGSYSYTSRDEHELLLEGKQLPKAVQIHLCNRLQCLRNELLWDINITRCYAVPSRSSGINTAIYAEWLRYTPILTPTRMLQPTADMFTATKTRNV